MNETKNRILSHPGLPISAPEWAWTAAGFQTYSNTDEVGHHQHHCSEMTELLALALAKGLDGAAAIADAVTEQQRRREASAQTSALAAEAKAIGQLAEAIAEAGEDSALQRIMPRLTERTRLIVRAQLKS